MDRVDLTPLSFNKAIKYNIFFFRNRGENTQYISILSFEFIYAWKCVCFRMERQYYYKKREAAKRAPNKFLSLIVDGMDQCKFSLYGFCLPNGDTYKYFLYTVSLILLLIFFSQKQSTTFCWKNSKGKDILLQKHNNSNIFSIMHRIQDPFLKSCPQSQDLTRIIRKKCVHVFFHI